jgi:phage terminase small subunit
MTATLDKKPPKRKSGRPPGDAVPKKANGKFAKQSGILTLMQERFAVELAACNDKSKAARLAGVSERSAHVTGHQWMSQPQYKHVQDAVAEFRRLRQEQCDIEARDLVADLLEIARFDAGDLVDGNGAPIPLHKLPIQVRRALQEIEVRTEIEKGTKNGRKYTKIKRYAIGRKFWNKLQAYKQIAELLGLDAPKNVNLSGNVNVAVTDWDDMMGAAEERLPNPVEARITRVITNEPAEQAVDAQPDPVGQEALANGGILPGAGGDNL